MNANNEIILYQSDNAVQLEVMLENETVWLTLNQMSILFERDKSVISRHISNIFKEQELDKNSVVAKNATTASDGKTYLIEYYNLDVIISVGYRVKSKRGTQFRIWANKVLKDYLLKGYAVNQRIENLERRVSATEDKIDFFVKTALPPVQGIFYDGQIFDAYKFVADLVKSATKSIVLIDNYLDESVLILLSKRKENVKCQIFTNKISAQFKLDLEKFNAQYPPVEVKEFSKSHDRFLIIDDAIYHIGASLKDLGKKWFAFSKINLDLQDILKKIYQ
ncbi:MAG TPA: RhuM family protein [Paludibacteraceae bacterium]|nr:RhuM family protein [Paludibacteraceae bacterium]